MNLLVDAHLVLERARQLLAGAWRYAVAAAIAVAVLFAFASSCNRAARFSAEVDHLREAARLRDAGAPVADELDAGELRARLAAAEKGNADLAAALAELRRVAPDARPVAVVHASAEFIAGDAPRRDRVRPSGYDGSAASAPAADPPAKAAGATSAHPTSPTSHATSQPCDLAAGDRVRIDIDALQLDLRGVPLITGAAALYRVDPDGEVRIGGHPWSKELTRAAVLEAERPEDRNGWTVGALGGLTDRGAVVTALAQTPELWRVRAVAVAGGGPGGVLVLGGLALRP